MAEANPEGNSQASNSASQSENYTIFFYSFLNLQLVNYQQQNVCWERRMAPSPALPDFRPKSYFSLLIFTSLNITTLYKEISNYRNFMLFWSEGIVLLPYIYYTKENVNVVLVFCFHVFLDHIKNYKTALKNHYRSGGT
jgi:hypothetical protein